MKVLGSPAATLAKSLVGISPLMIHEGCGQVVSRASAEDAAADIQGASCRAQGIIAAAETSETGAYSTTVTAMVMKVSKHGGAPVTLVSSDSGSYPSGIAVDGTSVYWIDVNGNVRKTPE
jgi:hypothetical protein